MGNIAYAFSRSCSIAGLPSRRRYAPMSRLSRTLIAANRRRPSGTWAMPAESTACASAPASGAPPKAIEPERVSTSPEMARNSVVLPAPFEPIRQEISPRGTCRSMPQSTCTSP
jgi:hypothetical protein